MKSDDWADHAFYKSMFTLFLFTAAGAVLFGMFGGRDWLPVGIGFGFFAGLIGAGVVYGRVQEEARRQEREELEEREARQSPSGT